MCPCKEINQAKTSSYFPFLERLSLSAALSVGVIYNLALYGLFTAVVRTTEWSSETLHCGDASKHTCCSVPAARWGLAMGEWGVWIKGSRVLFHYPIDADLPPSQCSLLLKICFSVSLLFSVLFSHGSCRDQLWVWPGWVGEGIIILLQTEEKVWYWYSSVGVRRWGSDFCSSEAIEILL